MAAVPGAADETRLSGQAAAVGGAGLAVLAAAGYQDDLLTLRAVAHAVLCVAAGGFVYVALPACAEMLIDAKLWGYDLNKLKPSDHKIPEGGGLVAGLAFLCCLFVYIPFHYEYHLQQGAPDAAFPHAKFVEFVSALLSICCMLFLGFADDVLNLRWRHKLLLPTVASLPLLVVYAINFNSTSIMVPKQFRDHLGTSLDLGVLFYGYMSMLAVFCTNAINILAGINGIEAAQSLVIAVSLAIVNAIQMARLPESRHAGHELSFTLLLPFIAVTCGMLYHNWFPAHIFVGDTYCYFAGMTFAVVGILGHFSKTLLLFFALQIFNFLYSVPQLFHIISCPRHRMPKLNPRTGLMNMSYASVDPATIGTLGKIVIAVLERLHLAHIDRSDSSHIKVSNLTVINFVLFCGGPVHERDLVVRVLLVQVAFSVLAFIIRFYVASFFYEEVL